MRAALNDLLGILRTEGHSLPKDARCITKTPRSVDTVEKCAGQYVYLGLENGIKNVVSRYEWLEWRHSPSNGKCGWPTIV